MVDELFFSKNSEYVYYWLGFILADGHIRHSRPHQKSLRLALTLANKDEAHLRLFQKQIKQEKGFGYNAATRSVRLTVCNTKFVSRLIKRGIPLKNKSFTAKPIPVPKKYLQHFWRGVWDGDGSIYLTKKAVLSNPAISLVGTWAIVNGFRLFLGLNNKGIRRHRRIWEFRRNGTHNVLSAYQKLYKNATVFLFRKKIKFEALQSAQQKFWEGVISNTIPGSTLTRRQQYYAVNRAKEQKKALDYYYKTFNQKHELINARHRQYRKNNLMKMREYDHKMYLKKKAFARCW